MKKLYRSQSDQKISGVCGGLSRFTGIDATLIRLVTVAAALFSFGTVLILYIIAGFIIPKEPVNSFTDHPNF